MGWRNGRSTVRAPITGRFNVRLCSARVGHLLQCKAQDLLSVPASQTRAASCGRRFGARNSGCLRLLSLDSARFAQLFAR